MNQISKNQDITRLVNFRLRKSDLDVLDNWCDSHHISRTKGVETLIRNLPLLHQNQYPNINPKQDQL